MTTATVGGVLILASGAVSAYALWQYQVAIHHLDAGDDDKYVNDANRMHGLARYGGTGLFVAGGLALGVAAYLYVFAPEKMIVHHLIVAPAATADGGGFTVAGRF